MRDLCLAAAMVGLVAIAIEATRSGWVFAQPAADGIARGIMIVGDVLQIGSPLWIVRFLAETSAQR